MHMIASLFACLVCTAHGRRVLQADDQIQALLPAGGASPLEALGMLLLAAHPEAAWQAGVLGQGGLRRHSPEVVRRKPVVMGKRGGARAPKQGITQTGSGKYDALAKMLKKKEDAKKEWVRVCSQSEVGNETGSTKAVEAGFNPQGQPFIWTLIRADPPPADMNVSDQSKTSFWAVDGQCRCCVWPMINAKTEKENGRWALRCGLCGTQYSLEDGQTTDWLPARNPIEWVQKRANEKKEKDQGMGILQTRVNEDGTVDIRVPDGTLTENPKDTIFGATEATKS